MTAPIYRETIQSTKENSTYIIEVEKLRGEMPKGVLICTQCLEYAFIPESLRQSKCPKCRGIEYKEMKMANHSFYGCSEVSKYSAISCYTKSKEININYPDEEFIFEGITFPKRISEAMRQCIRSVFEVTSSDEYKETGNLIYFLYISKFIPILKEFEKLFENSNQSEITKIRNQIYNSMKSTSRSIIDHKSGSNHHSSFGSLLKQYLESKNLHANNQELKESFFINKMKEYGKTDMQMLENYIEVLKKRK